MNDAEVIFCPLPLLKRRFFYGWRAIAFIAILSGALVIAAAGSRMARPQLVALMAFVLLGNGLTGLFIACMSRRQQEARRPRAIGDNESSRHRDAPAVFSRIIFELELARPTLSFVHEGAWSWAEFDEQRRQAGLPRPRALADVSLRPAIFGLKRPGDLLEPEPILASTPLSLAAVIAMEGVCAFVAVRHVLQGRTYLAAAMLVPAVMLLIQVPQVRERVPVLRADEQAPVAGVGYIETHRGRKWTVGDSMLLISATKASGPLYVRLVGPSGRLSWTFMSPSDPDFLRLWQRWMHPRPRLELAG